MAKAANDNGYAVGTDVVDGLLMDMVSSSTVKVSCTDDEGVVRELTLDETQQAGGGIALALALAVVSVGALVVTGVGVITYAALTVSTYVWAHTSVWTYASTSPESRDTTPDVGLS